MYTNILIIVRNQSKELHGLRCLHDMSNPLKTKLLLLFKEKCCFVTLIFDLSARNMVMSIIININNNCILFLLVS